jgi:hypothetical protein
MLHKVWSMKLLANWRILVGAATVGFGAWAIAANELLYGAILTCLGPYLMFRASAEAARNDSAITTADIRSDIADVKAAIANAQKIESTTEREAAIQIIDNEFEKWAVDFESNRHVRRLHLDQARTQALLQQLEHSKTPRDFVVDTLATIERAVAAYSRKLDRLIECNFPAIPEDVFMKRGDDRWTGEVLIDHVVVWQIEVRTISGDLYSFDINVPILGSRSNDRNSYIVISLQESANSVWTWRSSANGHYFAQFPDCEARNMPLTDKVSLKEMLRKWIETEILLFDDRQSAAANQPQE